MFFFCTGTEERPAGSHVYSIEIYSIKIVCQNGSMGELFTFEKIISLGVTRANQVLFDANDNVLVYEHQYAKISMLSCATGAVLDTFENLSPDILTLDLRRDGTLCAYSRNVAAETHELLLLDLAAHTVASYPLTVPTESANSRVLLKVTNNLSYLAISAGGGLPSIYIYEAADYRAVIKVNNSRNWVLLDMALSEELIYVLGRDGQGVTQVLLFSTVTHACVASLPAELVQGAKCLAYSAENQLLALATDGAIYLFDGTDHLPVGTLYSVTQVIHRHTASDLDKFLVGWLSFSHMGNLLLCHHYDLYDRVPDYLDIFSNAAAGPVQLIKSAAKR